MWKRKDWKPMSAWHSKSLGETLGELGTHRTRGLTEGEAEKRQIGRAHV